MQVGEETHLNHAVGVLLHPDPRERAEVTDEPRGALARGGKGNGEGNRLVFVTLMRPEHERVGPTCPAALQELKQDINKHCDSQSVPGAAISQFIH